jgi:hypothetical protein
MQTLCGVDQMPSTPLLMLRATLLALTAGAVLAPESVIAGLQDLEGADGPETSYGVVTWTSPDTIRSATFALTGKSIIVQPVDRQDGPLGEPATRIAIADITSASWVEHKKGDAIRVTQHNGRVDEFYFRSLRVLVSYADRQRLRALDDLQVRMNPPASRGAILAEYNSAFLQRVPGPECRPGLGSVSHGIEVWGFYIAERQLFWYDKEGRLDSLPIAELKDVRPLERHFGDWEIALVRSDGSCMLLHLWRPDQSSEQKTMEEARSTILTSMASLARIPRANGEASK